MAELSSKRFDAARSDKEEIARTADGGADEATQLGGTIAWDSENGFF